MKDSGRLFWLIVGIVLGAIGTGLIVGRGPMAQAANDRHEDYIMCTGPVAISPRAPTDGVWLLDYRTGKLLGTVIDRTAGKLVGWAELDLAQEFGLQVKQDVHFLMTTGTIAQGQAALYVAETSTGKFGVYTMGPRGDNQNGVLLRRHDLVLFRKGK